MFEKIKIHWQEHKEKYYIGAIAALTVTTTALYFKNNKCPDVTVSPKVSNFLSYKPNNEITIDVKSRVHPGWVVQDTETGNVYSSQNEAAKALGVSASSVSNHLSGKYPDVGGHVLSRIAKANTTSSQE